jgi:hypothetical protein
MGVMCVNRERVEEAVAERMQEVLDKLAEQ